MRNLNRLTNYANKIEAWEDWKSIAIKAWNAGRMDLVMKYRPADNASWRKIDKCTSSIKEGLNEAQDTQA